MLDKIGYTEFEEIVAKFNIKCLNDLKDGILKENDKLLDELNVSILK